MAEVLDVLKEIECPVCFLYMMPPIFLCTEGHSICSNCRKNVSTCPTCRKNMSNSRNYLLEKIAEKVPISCTYKLEGCDRMLTFEERKNHEKNCFYGPAIVSCVYKSCSWSGKVQHLKAHWILKKRLFIKAVNEFYIVKCPSINQNTITHNVLAEAYQTLFMFQLHKDKDCIKFGVQSLVKKNETRIFIFKVKFTDQNAPEREIIFSQYCSKIGEDIFSKDKSISVSHLLSLFDYIKDDTLTLSLCVKEKK